MLSWLWWRILTLCGSIVAFCGKGFLFNYLMKIKINKGWSKKISIKQRPYDSGGEDSEQWDRVHQVSDLPYRDDRESRKDWREQKHMVTKKIYERHRKKKSMKLTTKLQSEAIIIRKEVHLLGALLKGP